MRRLFLVLSCVILLLTGCQPVAEERVLFAMDTVMTLRLEGDDGTVFALCQERIGDLEQKFSTTLSESEISRLNQTGTAILSADSAAVLSKGLLVSEQTDQSFCLSLYPVSRLWDFTGENPRIPSAGELEKLRPVVDDRLIRAEERAVTLPQGGGIDFGGIAKGYAADQLTALLAEQGIRHYFLSLGGNVQVGGGKPNGDPWRVGIADPDGGDYVGIVTLTDGAVVTAGGYQRNFTQDGKLYHHILDRTTLAPAESGLKSATVVTESGTLADAFATAFYVMGEEKALEFCRQRVDLECILITGDDRVVVSEGLKDRFTLR